MQLLLVLGCGVVNGKGWGSIQRDVAVASCNLHLVNILLLIPKLPKYHQGRSETESLREHNL